MGGGDKPTLLASHHPPRRACSMSLWPPQLRRSGEIRNPDVRAGVVHRAVDQRKVAVHAARQKRGVLVVGLHDEAVAFERTKILGQGQRNAGTAAAECRVGDRILAEALRRT